MEIKKLDPVQWRGYGFTARYQTGGCWDIVPVEDGFRMEHHSFGKVEERSFKDTLFGEWLEAPVVYGAFQDGELLGIAEGLSGVVEPPMAHQQSVHFSGEAPALRRGHRSDGEDAGGGGPHADGGAGDTDLQRAGHCLLSEVRV